MGLFRAKNDTLFSVAERPFEKEREMQKITEQNLEALLGLSFVCTEFAPQGDLRIDTLAFDKEQNAFVIIEYKNGNSWSVMDQGFTYLSLLLDRKAEFVLQLNKIAEARHDVSQINWEASRVIFIAPSFNTYQVGALNFQDVAFELYTLRRYGEDLYVLDKVQAGKSKARLAEINPTSTESNKVRRVQSEVRQYTIEDHFPENREESKALFEELTTRLFSLDSRLSLRPVKGYIGINIDRKNVFAVHVQRSGLLLHIVRFKPEDLNDPERKLKYMENSLKHYNVHISEFKIKGPADIDYAVALGRQVLSRYK